MKARKQRGKGGVVAGKVNPLGHVPSDLAIVLSSLLFIFSHIRLAGTMRVWNLRAFQWWVLFMALKRVGAHVGEYSFSSN